MGEHFHETHPSESQGKKCFNCLKCHCHSSPTLNFFRGEDENDTEIIWRMKNSQTAATYHAIFHIIIIRKRRQKIWQKEDEGKKCKKVEHNKKIFLLISFCFGSFSFTPYFLKGCQKQAFLLTPTQATHFGWDGKGKGREGARRREISNHLNRITSLIVYPAMCVIPQLSLCVFNKREIFLRFFSGEIKSIFHYVCFLKVTFRIFFVFSLNSRFLQKLLCFPEKKLQMKYSLEDVTNSFCVCFFRSLTMEKRHIARMGLSLAYNGVCLHLHNSCLIAKLVLNFFRVSLKRLFRKSQGQLWNVFQQKTSFLFYVISRCV